MPSTAATLHPLTLPADILDDPIEQDRCTRWRLADDGSRRGDTALRIAGMHCAACAGIIEAALLREPGVERAEVSAAAERARVHWDPRRTGLAAMIAAVHRAGYGAVPDLAAASREVRTLENRRALWRLFVAVFCAMQIMMLATPRYVATGGDLAPDLRMLLDWGSWLLCLPVLVFSATPFFVGAWRGLRQRAISMDAPVALGLLVTFVASSGAAFDPGGPFGDAVYFDSLTMFVAFLCGARFIELRARHRVAAVLEDAAAAMPQQALRLQGDDRIEPVSVARLVPGDRVRVPVGQSFPADGVILGGHTVVDEALLTGESAAVAKLEGAAVVAGSINRGAPVLMRVERVGADTRLAGIVALMQDAMTQRPALARAADRWAAPFLWTVVGLAAAGAAVWSVVDPSRAVWVAVSVLIVTCPCALSLAVPSALLSAASALARRGVLLRRLDALETMTRVECMYFDKTGTLTDPGAHQVAVFRFNASADDVGDRKILAKAASLAAWSSHPMSRALVDAAGDIPAGAWTAVEEIAGSGMRAVDADGAAWAIGSPGFVGATAEAGADGADGAGLMATIWVSRDGLALARIDMDESPRADAALALHGMREAGRTTVILSGDRPDRATAFALRLGADRSLGGATPESKLAEIAAAQARGLCVAMVGDGINDAPVLARADVSIAMGRGAELARAQADAVLMSDRVSDVVLLQRIAGRTMRVIRQNLIWAAVYNGACVPLALVGLLPPLAAGIGMAASSLLVVLNSLRLAR
jgi:Cu2+-exporting ATPase